MTRVVHTGDTHLGYFQYHRPERRDDFLSAFRQVAADAIDADVDAVVHAGDLFHDRQPSLVDIMGALSVLRTLDEANLPFLAVVGNHESKRTTQWLDLFETMGLATRLGSEPVLIGDTAFYGLDFVPRAKRADLDYEFVEADAEYAALVTHGLFEPFGHGDWDAREILAEASVSFDVLLLGDDHTPATKRIEDPHEAWLTYCGSTERASASEREDRGYNIVSFEDGIDIRRRGLDTRPFEFIEVDLGDSEGTERVCEQVGQYDVTDAVAVVELTGDGDEVLPADVESFAADQGALVTRVNDRREIDDEITVEVTFADPDQAVRERIQELGLSPAARDIDETVRESKVADSNVASSVEDHVSSLVDDADESVFVGAPTEQSDDQSSDNQTPSEQEDSGGEHDDGSEETATDTEASDGDSTDEDSESQVTMEDYQ